MTLSQSTSSIQIEVPEEKLITFCRQHRIRRLAFFGSVLREDFGPESDIDVLVEFESEARIGLLAFAGIQRDLSELLQRPVDLVTPEGLKPLIKDQVLNNAEVIYAP